MNAKTTNKQQLLRTIVLLAVLAAAVLAFSPAAAAAGAGDSKESLVILDVYSVTITADSTVTAAGYTVRTKDAGGQEKTVTGNPVFVGKNAQVLIKVNTLPPGYTLAVTTNVPDKTEISGNDVLIKGIAKNITVSLTAETSPVTYHTVSFDANGGSPQPEDVLVADGGVVGRPATDPSKPGCTFDDWYLGNAKYNFSTPVHESFTLVARYTQKPSPSPSGGGSIWEQLQDTRAVITTDVTRLYSGIPFFAATAVNLAEIQSVYPVYAAELAEKFAAAEAAGYKLVNSRGAPALAVLEHPDEKVIKEQFCKVYDITPVYAGAKIEKVEITVPMTDITASGLTYQDVNIYHGVDLPGVAGAGSGAADLWIPLEILNITFDEKNYYFTAATDGASPFGVLIKHFEPEGTEPGTLPTPVPKTAVPLAGLIAGLGAAGVLLGLKRK